MTTGSRLRARSALLVVVAALAATHLFCRLLPQVADPLERGAGDLLFRLRASRGWGARDHDPAVAYVAFTGEGVPDASDHAAVIRGLATLGPEIQVHDALYRSSAGGAAAAVREAGNVILGCVAGLHRHGEASSRRAWRIEVDGDAASVPVAGRPQWSLPELEDAALGSGFLDVRPDSDGVVRRAPLVARAGEGFIPCLALRAACAILDVPASRILLRPGRDLVLREARSPGGARADLSIPIDHRGFAILDWHARWEREHVVPAIRVRAAATDPLERELLATRLGRKIALVADLTTAGDDVATPLEPLRPGAGVHGQLLESILSRTHLRDMGLLAVLAVELVCAAGLFLAARARYTSTFLATIAATTLLFLAVATSSFVWARALPQFARPLVLLAGGTVAILVQRYVNAERRRAVLQGTFEPYFPPALVRRLIAQPDRITRAGERKILTVLFSDIRGFTDRSAVMEPGAVQEMLNRYFETMVEVVFAHEGTVDKFIGDGLMVFFGDPEPQADHAVRAVRCALDMQRSLAHVNAMEAHSGRPPLAIRIGIHTGPVIVGNLGAPRRVAYTVVGATVNLASRLEHEAPPGGVLISHATYEAVSKDVACESAGERKVKGFEDPVAVYLVRDAGPGPV